MNSNKSNKVNITPDEEQELIESGERDPLTKDDETIEDGRKIFSRAIDKESNTQEVIVRTKSLFKGVIINLIQILLFPLIYYQIIFIGLYLSGNMLLLGGGLLTAIVFREKIYKKYGKDYLFEQKYTYLTRYYENENK